MYKIYYAQRYRIRKYGNLGNRMNKLMNRIQIKERYKHEKKINPSIKYDVIKESNKSSFIRINTLFKARKQVNV
jgi:hypothetical protein